MGEGEITTATMTAPTTTLNRKQQEDPTRGLKDKPRLKPKGAN